jgi:glycosyltransferase involved in cell wall biosynthesis
VPDPLISVVLPTRDRRSMLADALRSVFDQTSNEALEVVVVDDGSSDGTADFLACLHDDRVRIVRHDRATGVSVARNDGIRAASGTWLAFLDDDDLWEPHKLERQLALAQEAGAGLVCTHALVIDEQRVPIGREELVDSDRLADELSRTNAIGTPSSVLVRRDLVVAAGGFDEQLSVLADWDLWLAILPLTRCVVCPEPLTSYMEHERGMHARRLDDTVREFAYLRRKHGALVEARGHRRLGSAKWWRWVASGYRRDGRRVPAALAHLRAGLEYRSRRDLADAVTTLLRPGGLGR